MILRWGGLDAVALFLVVAVGASCCFAMQPQDAAATSSGAPASTPLAGELLRRMEEDQAARQLWVNAMRDVAGKTPQQLEEEHEAISSKVKAIDERNRIWLAETIEQFCWPGKSLVGEQAAHAAWLLVQHADADPEFQQRCLERMKAAPPGEVSQIDIAYLTDRVLVAQKRPQIYGTQCRDVNGKFEPQECVDPERLDERRREVGLPPISEYLQQMESFYRSRAGENEKCR